MMTTTLRGLLGALAIPFGITSLLAQPGAIGSITRSDSIDVLHTRIDLDLTNVSNGLIRGAATIRLVPRVNNITQVPFDLLALTVDSVTTADAILPFTHAGEYLAIAVDPPLNTTDTFELTVYYGGDPAVDASGWGGFYTLSSYQYDLGVAFDAVPHSYGRAWFPCFDNFVERCSFEFIVTTSANRTLFANGRLVEAVDLGAGLRRTHWRMDDPIPSYLASVASTDYVAVHDTLPSISGQPVPVTLVAKPADTTDLKNSFLHLPEAFATFEDWFGPFVWDRVGYCLTTQGAMEHPTNIAYPVSIVDGTLAYENIMAHELAHHWFGDLITCRRAEEMYINEGFAEYLSYLFLEDLYGRARYLRDMRDLHHTMVSKAHLLDGGWYALSDVPQSVTYGEHSYRKGAVVIHALRTRLGDSLFSEGFKRVLTNNAFSDMSTEELRDSLSEATGLDLTSFFADRILQPGWASFEVDSIGAEPDGGAWNTTVRIEQKLRHADQPYTDVPAHITFEASDGTRWTSPSPVLLAGTESIVQVNTPFQPVHAFIDNDGLLALASTVVDDTLQETGSENLDNADITLLVNALPAPAPIRAEEFWTAADPAMAEPFAYQVSPDRWWRITGRFAPGTDVDLRILIDGRPTSANCFDPGLVQDVGGVAFAEDSLVMLYRPNARYPWSVHPEISINFLGADRADGYARLTAAGIQPGDYCVGWRKSAVAVVEPPDRRRWSVHPNPANDRIVVEGITGTAARGAVIVVEDGRGRLLAQAPVQPGSTTVALPDIPPQTVHVSVTMPGTGRIWLANVVIDHR
jgi:aminopeptidase N